MKIQVEQIELNVYVTINCLVNKSNKQKKVELAQMSEVFRDFGNL